MVSKVSANNHKFRKELFTPISNVASGGGGIFLQTSKCCNAQRTTTRRNNNICFVWISSPWDNVPGTLKGSFAQAECIRKMSLIESSPWREQSDVKIHSGLVE